MAGGMLMGGSVAIAALGTAFAFIAKTLSGLGPLKSLLGLLAAIMAFVLPASIVAVNKLRKRDISSILEGAGWSINARMHLNRAQGRAFTEKPKLPETAEVFPKTRWCFWAALGLVMLVCLVAFLKSRQADAGTDDPKTQTTTKTVERDASPIVPPAPAL